MQARRHDEHARAGVPALILFGLAAWASLVTFGLLAVFLCAEQFGGLMPSQYNPIYNVMVGHGLVAVFLIFSADVLRRRNVRSAGLSRLLIVATPFALLVSSDLLIGIVYPAPLPRRTIFEVHPRRGWAHVPLSHETGYGNPAGDKDVQLDRYGLRVEPEDAQRVLVKSQDHRILFIGDSVIFGYYVSASETVGAIATRLLNAKLPGANWIELNGGVTGYDTHQELDYLMSDGFALQPSLVVLGFCLNDVTKQFDASAAANERRHSELAQARRQAHWSGWARFGMAWRQRLRYGEGEQAAAHRYEHFYFTELLETPSSPRVESAWKRTFDLLDSVIRECRQRDIPLVVVTFPIWRQITTEAVIDDPQRRLSRFFSEKGVPHLDLLPVFRAGREDDPGIGNRLMGDQVHPTAPGHRVAGEALANFLLESGVVRPVPRRN